MTPGHSFDYHSHHRSSSVDPLRRGPRYGVVRDSQWTALLGDLRQDTSVSDARLADSPGARSTILRENSDKILLSAASHIVASRELVSASRLLVHIAIEATERGRVRKEEQEARLATLRSN